MSSLHEAAELLNESGIAAVIENTGGNVMVGYVYLSEDGPDGPHVGISEDVPGCFLVCSYSEAEDEGTPIATVPLDSVPGAVNAAIRQLGRIPPGRDL